MDDVLDRIDFVCQEIINQGKQAELLPGREMKLQGTEYRTLCPFHPDKTPSFDINRDKPVFICRSCGKSGHWIELIEQVFTLTKGEALARLEQIAGVPARPMDPQAAAQYEKARRAADIMTAAADYFRSALFEPQGKETLAYFQSRGYSADEIRQMGLGHYPGRAQTIKDLTAQGFTQADILAALKWIDYEGKENRKEYRAVIPCRDGLGRIVAMVGRPPGPPPGDLAKYKPFTDTAGIKNKTLFYIDRAKGAKAVIFVEGLLDCLIAQARGIANICALDGKDFSPEHLQEAARRGIVDFIFALDNDPAGKAGTEKAVMAILNAKPRAGEPLRRVYVVTYPDGIKDADELIKAQGIGALAGRIDAKEQGPRWMTRQIIERTGRGDLPKILDALKPLLGAADWAYKHEIYAEIRESLGLPQSDFDEIAQEAKKEAAQLAAQAKARGLANEIREALESENPDFGDIREKANDLYLYDQKAQARQTPPLADRLAAKFALDDQRTPGEPLGFRLKRFSNIQADLDGVQPGVYVIAGETSVGKTAFLTNFFLDVLEANQDLHGLYFSLDDNEQVIFGRLLAVLGGGDLYINDTHKPAQGPKKEAALKARAALLDLARSGRLEIQDFSQVRNIDDIEAEIRERAQGGRLIVVIDGLQNVDLGGNFQGLRDKNVELANKVKKLADIYRIPVLTSVEVRKKIQAAKPDLNAPPTINDIMETGKYAYNASLVWTIHPADYQAFFDNKEPWQTVILKILKNKLSLPKGQRKLDYSKPTGRLKEI